MATMEDILYGLGKTAEDKIVKPGAYGTTWRSPPLILMTIQNMSILSALIVGSAVFITLDFVLKPLIMAYFVTFLMAPVMDLFEKRPYDALGDKATCCKQHFASEEFWQYEPKTNDYFEKLLEDTNYEGKYTRPNEDVIATRTRITQDIWNEAKDRDALEGVQRIIKDFVIVQKIPHLIACLATLSFSMFLVFASFSLIYSNFSEFMDSEAEKQAAYDRGEAASPAIGELMNRMLNNYTDSLEETIAIYRELICPPRSLANVTVTAVKKVPGWSGPSAIGYTEFQFKHLHTFRADWDNKTDHCYRKKIFGGSEGMTWDEFMGYTSLAVNLANDTVLILLLAVYILMERGIGRTIGGDHACAMQIEDMVKSYISLKFALSFLTGLLVGIVLVICQVKMAVIFGFLSFLLNFIPNVGSMLAIVIPIPIIIMDTDLAAWQVYVSIGIPCIIQGYVGNALEPMLFGAALNLTAISVLLALVVFAYLWGMIGAVLSVPLLGGAKIVLYNTDHPIAMGMLGLVREDESLP